mgnify:CR=1 FL=1
MKQIINGLLYDTDKAQQIASDRYWAPGLFLTTKSWRNTYLYKTKKGNFFTYHTTRWQGERDHIESVDLGQAKMLYESLPEHQVEWEEAFGEAVEEA